MGIASLLCLAFAGLLGVLLARRAVRPLGQALILQRTFVADASHELRTPLTLLSTRTQLLDRAIQSSDLDSQVLEDSRGVVRDVQRLGEVVDDLLLAADPRADEDLQPVDLALLVEAVVDSAGAHAAHVRVALTCTADEPDGSWVLGSAPALRRAVLSLVENAIDHTPPPGEVHVHTRTERGNVLVSVSDTGPGIDPATAQDVLRRFHSGGHRAGRAHYGLGLALTHDVANRHGGQLRLVPSEVGATFELVLPAYAPT
jgi:signal transduction histidine kinase